MFVRMIVRCADLRPVLAENQVFNPKGADA
jgi:hypothetical protein